MTTRTYRDPDTLLNRAGVRGDSRRDQYFLIDDRVLDRILEYAEARIGVVETVLEVGPGTGALTDRLFDLADHVIAVERDQHLVTFLRREFAEEIEADDLTVIHGDALEVELPRIDAVVANLPYGISSEILFRVLPMRVPMIVMVQREFADRLCASPDTSEYGRLTVTAGHYAEATLLEPVPPTAFQPPPPVESAIVGLSPRATRYEVADEERFLALVTALFTQRRKTLRNAIRNTTHLSDIDDPSAVIDALPEEWLSRRPGTLSPAEFAELAQVVAEVEETTR